MKKVLVFVAKTTGFECLKWLLTTHPNDQYTFFVSAPDKTLIINYLTENGHGHHDLEHIKPEDITEGQHYDWLINIWSPYIFRKTLLERVENSVNLHPSYLPYGRGRDPVVWAIQDNVPAGATLHKITEGIDEGPIYAQIKIDHEFPISGGELYNKVEQACIDVFCENWNTLRNGNFTLTQQGRADLPTRKRNDLITDRTLYLNCEHAKDVINKIRSHDFSENGYTALLKDKEKTYSVTLNIQEIIDKEAN